MDEEKKQKSQSEEKEQEEKKPVEEEKNTLIDDTNLASKRLEDATKAAAEEREKAEQAYSKMKLGGTAEAGGTTQAPKDDRSEDQKSIDYANSIMNGNITVEDILMTG